MKIPKLKKPTLERSKGASSVKPPKALADLYADLRDRRLLPLVALLAVAIVAAPFLLADKSPSEPGFVPAPAATKATAASFSVVPAKPQLRDYRKRLQHRKRESPFSTYAAVRASNETREAVEGAIQGTADTPVPTAPTTEVAPESAPAPVQPPIQKTTVKANVGLAAVIKAGYAELEPNLLKVEPQSRLPKPEKPIVIYTGPSKNNEGAQFLMSNSVTAYYGSGKCVLGGEICQVLELTPGKSATFAVGYGETRYKVTFLGFEPIVKEATFEPGG